MRYITPVPQCGEECPERLSMPEPTELRAFALCETHDQWWQVLVENPDAPTFKWRAIDMPPYAVLQQVTAGTD